MIKIFLKLFLNRTRPKYCAQFLRLCDLEYYYIQLLI